MFWCDARGSAANCTGTMNTARAAATFQPPSSPVALQEGHYFNQYLFRVPISSTQSVGSFWFTVKDGASTNTYNNGGALYKLEHDNVIFAPRLVDSSNTGSHGHHRGPRGSGGFQASLGSQEVVVGVGHLYHPFPE
jgi:hypothetical protein